MYVPGLMERVRLSGVEEVYLVLTVDRRRRMADLLPIRFGGERLRQVPFDSVKAIQRDATEQLSRR